MFLVACVVTFQLAKLSFGEASVFLPEYYCSAWSDEDRGGNCSPTVSREMHDVHGSRLMQLESFVTRLARQQADSERKPRYAEAISGKHGSPAGGRESKDASMLEGDRELGTKSHKTPPKQLSSTDSASRNAHRESADPAGHHGHASDNAASRALRPSSEATENVHLMALRPASAPGGTNAHHAEKVEHAHSERSHDKEPKASTLEKTKMSQNAAKPTHDERSSPQRHAVHPSKEDMDQHAGKAPNSPHAKIALKGAKPLAKLKAEDSDLEEDEEASSSRHQLHSRVQKASHKKKESHSLLNPAIMTVMFLMSAPAGMLLLAFGSLLLAKIHGDSSMGGD